MKKKILFITSTPYQFISAYCICIEKFSANDFENIIYFLNSDRTDYEMNTSIDYFNGTIVRFEQKDWVGLIKNLEKQLFHRFFFFQENAILNKYLAYQLKKKGTIVCLAPDGTKPYGEFSKKHEFLSMIKDTIHDYKLLAKNHLKIPKLILSRYYRYGATYLLDEVWLQYPELFNATKNKTNGKIVCTPPLKSNHIQSLIKLFNFKKTLLTDTDKIILYFNQPFNSNELIAKEFEILESISKLFPDKKVHIKLHPSTKAAVKMQMMELAYIELIDDKLPAEFYLGIVSNSILLTGWSAALMHNINHQNNVYYYLYKMYKSTNDITLSQITFFGFPHIVMVDDLKELQFPNE